MSMKVIDDPTVLKSSKVYLSGPYPYRYVLRYVPKQDPSHPYHANRENMKLVSDTWEPECKYWTSCRDSLEEAEKEYQKKLDTEPKY
jgi:hypothetical protein